MDRYGQFRQILDTNPSGAPKSEAFYEILRLLFSPEDIARVVAERCIGCDLCVTGCPSEAIELVERENIPEIPETTQEMGLRIAEEKGKLDDFIKIMKR